MASIALRISRSYVRHAQRCNPSRSFYTKAARFITADTEGSLTEREVTIRIGDEHEAYVLVPTDIGDAIKAHGKSHKESSVCADSESLVFHHDSRSFTCLSGQYPRLVIPQDLPRRSNTESSPATLYLFGATHTIALDGTPDADFARKSRDTWYEMKPVLDNLKDM